MPVIGGRRRGEQGIVGFNLALTIAFALFAVIELSRVVLAATQIGDRVKVIITEVGPGSNVSRLDETAKLDETGRMAEEILIAAKPLSGQLQQVIDAAGSIDSTVTQINNNAGEINSTVRSINSQLSALQPVVQTIHGDDSMDIRTGGVAAINKRAAAAAPVIAGIQQDVSRANILGMLVSVDRHAVAICNGTLLGVVGRCTPAVEAQGP
jgi:methyl-accepting chemotaxis protein